MKFFLICTYCCFFLVNCNRSTAYRQEQTYYKQDSNYSNRLGSATSRAERFGQPKKRAFALPFANNTPFGGDELGVFAADELLRELRSTGKAVVPEDLRVGSRSQDFYSGDKVRLGPLIREGKNLGVALLIIGKIKKITYRTKDDDAGLFRQKQSLAAADIEMRVFDVSAGKEILFDEKSADGSSSQINLFGKESDDPKTQRQELVQMALRNGMKMFSSDAAQAISKISWEGRIAKISGGKTYVNAGRATGLNIGDILKVMTTGEDVYDPITGSYMGRGQGQPKGTLEITDFFGPDGSVAQIHSGGNFVENDIVQLY